jgi:CheY-like chemotaxis protein
MNKMAAGGKGVSLHINRLGWYAKFCHDAAMRVLIADDQKSVGTSLAEMVRRCQHQVVEVVGSGLEAIHAFGRHHPDVVLMDYQMPKLNGATACRNIMAKYPEARVILVSGGSRDNADSGAIAVLQKPVKLDSLYAALYAAAQPRSSA